MVVLLLLCLLVIMPAVAGVAVFILSSAAGFQIGDSLVYRKQKVSPHPGLRARNVSAAEHGDDYYYEVDKYWTLVDVLDDGRLAAVTRTGKIHVLQPTDPNLRKAKLIEQLRYRDRFPQRRFQQLAA